MMFSLFCNPDTLGEFCYGLACSNINDSTSTAIPLIPLVIYTLLGNTNGPALLHWTAFAIAPILTPVIQNQHLSHRVNYRDLFQKLYLYVCLSFDEELISLMFSRQSL